MTPIETERLRLRYLQLEDADFILELVNEPAWLDFIGDRGVRTLDDARRYLEERVLAMYARHGLGSYAVELKATGERIGSCGLLKRDGFADVDLGYAFLSRHWGRGYALEAAAATLAHGRSAFGLERIVAMTDLKNERSIRVLEKLGFRFERIFRAPPGGRETRLFAHGRESPLPTAAASA